MIKKLLKTAIFFVAMILAFVPFRDIAKADNETKTHSIAENPVATMPIEDIVVHFANQYGADPNVMLAVMRCESHGKQSTVGDHGNAKGIYQYWEETWQRHSKKLGETLDKNSPYDQAKLASYAIANGMGNEWTTYRAIKNGGSYTFWYKLQSKYITVYCKA